MEERGLDIGLIMRDRQPIISRIGAFGKRANLEHSEEKEEDNDG